MSLRPVIAKDQKELKCPRRAAQTNGDMVTQRDTVHPQEETRRSASTSRTKYPKYVFYAQGESLLNSADLVFVFFFKDDPMFVLHKLVTKV